MKFYFAIDVKPTDKIKTLKEPIIKRLTDAATSAALHAITEKIPFDADIKVIVTWDSCMKANAKTKGSSQ